MGVGDLPAEKRGVSPVIGVVLMVAVTVILAAIVGTFVLGIGGDQGTTPQATFEVEQIKEGGGVGDPDELRITHTGGNSIEADELYLAFDDTTIQKPGGGLSGSDRLAWDDLDASYAGETVDAGDAVAFEPADGDPEIEDKTLRVIWDDGEGTAILYVWTGPDA